jgi:DNA primase
MSGIIPKETVEAIRDACDIVDVIGSYLSVRRAGSAFKALCPFHNDTHPSLHINPSKQIYRCFVCEAGGDVFQFLMDYDKVDFATAVRLLADRCGIRVETDPAEARKREDKDVLYRLHDAIAAYYTSILEEGDAGAPGREYLERRGIDRKTAAAFRLGYAPDGPPLALAWGRKHGFGREQLVRAGILAVSDRGDGSTYDKFRGRLLFPITDETGRITGFSGRILDESRSPAKYLNTPETPIFQKSRILFALDRARKAMVDSGRAIICEGQIDTIRCHMAGFAETVGLQGTALTPEHARLLKRYADSAVFVFDSDKAGREASVRSAEVFLAAELSVRIAVMTPGEDPDTLIRKQGGDAFQALLEGALSPASFLVRALREHLPADDAQAAVKIARRALDLIRCSPSALLRDQLLADTARELGVSEDSLRSDMNRRLQARRGRPTARAAEGAAAAPAHPPDEVAALECLALVPEVADLARAYLPGEAFTDPACRRIAEELLRPGGSAEALSKALAGEEDATVKLAARVQMPEPRRGGETSPEDAFRDLVIRLNRKWIERRRAALRESLSDDVGPARVELHNLTLDLNALREALLLHDWEKAEPILDLHRAAAGR